jgi:phenylpyruvate tautomerase PptA (4-oxalocrotonate tautomerase family)
MANQENNKVISPVIESGQGHIFHVNGANFKVTGSHIELVEKTNDVFNTLVSANNLFTINENGISFYYDYNNKKAVSKIEEGALANFDKMNDLNEKVAFLNESIKNLKSANKKGEALEIATKELDATQTELNETKKSAIAVQFTYVKESNTFFAGKMEITLGSEEKLSERFFNIGYIKYQDKAIVEAFQTAATNFDTYKVLDFVEESTKDQVTVISMKAENNAFVYRRNEDTKITQFKKLLADAAVEYVAEQTGADVTELYAEVLESLVERRTAKNEKINLYNEMLSFLHDQVGRLAEADRNLTDIKAADHLLKSEIKRISEELDGVQNEDLLNIEDGYVGAQLKVESDGMTVGTSMKVDALEYTNAGKNDILTVFIKDEPARIEKFKIALDSIDAV